MPTIVEIRISGLAVCYRANSIWNVDFLCDDNHQLLYRHSGEPSNVIAFGAVKNLDTLDIEVLNPVNKGAAHAINFPDIFNMAVDAHAGGVTFATPSPPRRRVRMTIQHGELGAHKLTPRRYGIKKENDTGSFKPLRRVAKIVGVKIKLQDTGRIILKAKGAEVPLPIDNNGILSFDNDCRQLKPQDCRSGNDSLYFMTL
jgi:hypothetical protein